MSTAILKNILYKQRCQRILSKEASKEINAIYKLSKSEIYIPMGTPNLMNNSNKKSIKRILSRRKEVLNLLFKGEKIL